MLRLSPRNPLYWDSHLHAVRLTTQGHSHSECALRVSDEDSRLEIHLLFGECVCVCVCKLDWLDRSPFAGSSKCIEHIQFALPADETERERYADKIWRVHFGCGDAKNNSIHSFKKYRRNRPRKNFRASSIFPLKPRKLNPQ